ncbi:hypothetical protein OsccyDRAFT_0187 [Leptolyngbyaceae cyanobacterium JSC-12]|nr:hypothetical protein OsccyDRAFT_0187 [Leptolyngbyaceae cyanobacterium JSC-12]
MKSLCRSLKIIPLAIAASFSLMCASALAQECSLSKPKSPELSSSQSLSGKDQSNSIRSNSDQTADSATALKSDASGKPGPWAIAAIAAVTVAGGSAALVYRARLACIKTSSHSSALHPALEHPELLLTELPSEALPELSNVDSSLASPKREGVLTR